LDDEKMITTTLASLIKIILKCPVETYNDPIKALNSEALLNQNIDLIISDFMMPGMNGLEFLKNVKEISPDTIMVLLTGYADKESAIRSINEVGLYYYLEKPWDNTNLIKIITNGLEKKELSRNLELKRKELEESNEEIGRLYELLKKDYNQEVDNVKSLIITLANVIEAKDKYTDGHTRRVSRICYLLGKNLGLDHEKLKNLEISGIIHDIGKVGIPENIINKPGKLSDEEFEEIKKHTIIGETICKPLNSLQTCLDPIRHHHEKLDGSGYPDGLADKELSLEARIIAVADIFDALYSDRPYRARMSLPKIKAILAGDMQKGKLDAVVVNELLRMIDKGELASVMD
jgi:Response regulator containing a CheY-like receiver domain and an HD-GYP domain